MGIRIGVEATSLRDLDFILLDQHFLTRILGCLVHLLVTNFELLLHQCFQFVNYATLRATLLHFVEIRLLSIPNVTFVEELITPPYIASIMKRVLTTLECTPVLLILHNFPIICLHRTCSILHLQLLLSMYLSHFLNTELTNSPLCKPCMRGLTLPLHPHVLQVLHKYG